MDGKAGCTFRVNIITCFYKDYRSASRRSFSSRCGAPIIFIEFYPAYQKKVQRTATFDASFLNKQAPKPCIRNQILRINLLNNNGLEVFQ